MANGGYISQVNLPNNTSYDIKAKSLSARTASNVLIGTGTAGSYTNSKYYPAKWTFNTGAAPSDGDIITIKIPVAGHDYGVFLSTDNGTTYYPIVCSGTGRLTTHYPVNTYLTLIFESTGSAASMFALDGQTSSTRITVSNGVWRVINYYDSNSNDTGYYHRRIYPNIKAGTGGIHPYALIMQLSNGKWSSIVDASSTNPGASNVAVKATGKNASTNSFVLGHVLLMYANAEYAADANVGTYNIWSAHTGLIDARYSFNLENASGKGFVGYKPVYIVGTVTNGLFTLDTTKWWAQDLPTTVDNKVYIYIGDAYDWYRLTFTEDKPIYWYRNGAIRLYGGDAETVNGLTVQTAVPANAVFTDTKSFTITANATDGYWDLTGTNGTNAVTYALAPYSSKQSGANFYTGTTNPDGTTRLNYNGYLYATKLYSGGTEVSVSGHNHNGTYVPMSTGANDINTIYDTSIKNITSGSMINGPTSYGYGEVITFSYRKHTGNTTPDYATQLYAHYNANTTGNCLYFRTSSASAWNTWQMVAHADAGTAIGGATTPVYVDAKGIITAGTALGGAAYKAADYYALASHGTHVTSDTVKTALGIKSQQKSLSAAGWYRILDCTSYSESFLITFYGGYNYQPPTPVTFLVSHSYNLTKITQIGRSAYIGWITKIRAIHYDTSKFYIDVYFAWTTGSNSVNFEINPLDPTARNNITLVDYTLITDSLTSNAECNTSTNVIADLTIGANITSTKWGIAYYSDAIGTFASTGAGTSGQYLKSNGSSAPTWATFEPATVGLSNVENTKLSTWTGSSNISTVGTITSGTWNGTAIAASYIGDHSTDKLTSGTLANARLPARLQEYHTSASNDSTISGWHYGTTGSPFTKYHTSNADFMVWTHGYSSAWASELATDFRTNRFAVRNLNNGTWNSWRELAGNNDIVNEFVWSSDIYYDSINNRFTNTRATSDWASQIYSKHGFSDGCYVSFRVEDTTHYRMVGLNSDPTNNASYNTIDYAWYPQQSGNLNIYENGTSISSISGHTTYTAGDDFRIEYNNGQIRYYHNGVCCRTVERAISGQLYLDSSLYNGGTVTDLRFGPITNIGTISVAHGGTGATDAANARTNLGLGTAATYDIVGTGNKNGYSSTKVLIPRILTDGVMEVGKYIDFHASAGDSVDYDVRITAATTGLTISGTTSGTFSGNLSGNATSATKVAAKLATTTKTFLLGTSTTITGTAANVDLIGDTGVYLTTTAGQLSAKSYLVNDGSAERVQLIWNSTDLSLDFIFA